MITQANGAMVGAHFNTNANTPRPDVIRLLWDVERV